jgi:uncharacterized membrane protein YphA (DoxX/SURF4 family)
VRVDNSYKITLKFKFLQKQFGVNYQTIGSIGPAFGGITNIINGMFTKFGALVTMAFFIWFILSIKQYNEEMATLA